ncbi:MAG: DUF2182 domain-containing protein [Gemmatimonadetes bacterium]|nr:DUF2182 domain-containing protein [Gemmatimonadota bacterium]
MPMHAHGASGASFVGMWALMMVPMMLPSLAPVLARVERPLVVALGYYAVWTAVGVAVHAVGLVVGPVVPARPWVSGVVVLVAGGLQFTAWKARALARCRAVAAAGGGPWSVTAAWRHGLRLGARCVCSCAGPTAVLLALGAMDLRVMGIVAVAITAERLARRSLLAARIGGAVAVGAGVVLLSQVG